MQARGPEAVSSPLSRELHLTQPVSGSLIAAPDGPLNLEDRLLGEGFSLTPKVIILGNSVGDTS